MPQAVHDHALFDDFGWFEWSLTVVAGLFVAWSIWKAVRYTMYPGEESPDHVKRIILGDDGPQNGGRHEAGLSSEDGGAAADAEG